ncbi:MAG TPA: M20/M25/M40 family metallo-hydrolase [Longimicrobiales bacterium]|nr:M20/M25/M40 family metallo-hydrolase [Longimicrobiales bacterium]
MRLTRVRTVVMTVVLAACGVAPAAAQTFRSDDPVIRQMWLEGMERSQAERLAQVLMDSIGHRLSGSPGYESAGAWILQRYADWGVPARQHEYGTWRGWNGGSLLVNLVAPRVQTLEANWLAWSPGTNGRPVQADVVIIPEFASTAEAEAWLGTIRGRAILASPPEATCREPQAMAALARPETVQRLAEERARTRASWQRRMAALGQGAHARLEQAGVAAVLTSRWSEGWGVNKVFDAPTTQVPALDISCEDYGLLYRLAANNQGPRVMIQGEAENRGTVPMFSVIAELRGTELPDEYVVLSAHLDSWHAGTGATDNGTGTIMMLEAMRILRAAYPNPRRTIIVGHWGGEEQGLIGSRAFGEDHPEVLEGMQALFNQDNGTWRIEYLEGQGYLHAGEHLARWISNVPLEISSHVELDFPGQQINAGSDHTAFICHGVPAFRFQSHYDEYRQYTWHTNRDTFDKIVLDDLMNNATLAAMVAYMASEDPRRVPRDRATLPTGPTGQERRWPTCAPARRSWQP